MTLISQDYYKYSQEDQDEYIAKLIDDEDFLMLVERMRERFLNALSVTQGAARETAAKELGFKLMALDELCREVLSCKATVDRDY